ncbi:MAG: phosphate acyltransferase PlsX [Puniceicoccales bacterium]|jgi:glycerol-3-phosphate acyltransferase PlsX|nr:phosphate acyltransferase PlsX [Puniceicoccales bacterium]
MDGHSDDTTVAVDVMGADNGVSVFVRGVVYAAKNFPSELGNIVLVGHGDEIGRAVSENKLEKFFKKINIVHASQEVEMTDKPISALRSKKDSSMFRAIELVKDGYADGMLSCGNTGCLMAGGALKLRTMPGIDRPALCTMIPAPDYAFALIDVGANPSSTAKNLVHNAVLGSHYFKTVTNVENPRIGLLTIGTEEGKGSDLVCEAHRLLKLASKEINYSGLIEGFQLFDGTVDVVVCDGFVGNILLKSVEAMAKTIKAYIRREIRKNPLRMLGAVLASGAFLDIKKQLNPDKFNGAPFLGLNGTIIKSHGSSSVEGISSALRLACKTARASKFGALSEVIKRVNLAINQV